MEITIELDDSNLEPVVEAWADSNLDDRIEAWMENHTEGGVDTVAVEGAIQSLLDEFTPGGGGCRTARSFETAVNGILDHRGELVLKPANDALAEMVTKEVEKQVTIMVVNIQRGLRRLHSLDGAGPEVAGAI
jgi:hypothetical protein